MAKAIPAHRDWQRARVAKVLNTPEQVTRAFSERAASSLPPLSNSNLELVQQQLNCWIPDN